MNFNDFELLSLAREGNEDAINIIYEKYKPLIVKKSTDMIKKASHHGIDINDIIQEGYIALDEAIRNYNQSEDASFYTFSSICIERRINNYIRKNTSKKSMVLNDALAIDNILGKTISNDINIEKMIVSNDSDNGKIKQLKKELTSFEESVFDLRLKDYSFEEIATILNKDLKSIYNAFGRIKTKYKQIIKIDN